jgi:hypothetical protein
MKKYNKLKTLFKEIYKTLKYNKLKTLFKETSKTLKYNKLKNPFKEILQLKIYKNKIHYTICPNLLSIY